MPPGSVAPNAVHNPREFPRDNERLMHHCNQIHDRSFSIRGLQFLILIAVSVTVFLLSGKLLHYIFSPQTPCGKRGAVYRFYLTVAVPVPVAVFCSPGN